MNLILIILGLLFLLIGIYFAKALMTWLNSYHQYLDKKIQLFIVVGISSYLAMQFLFGGTGLILGAINSMFTKQF